jgi:4-hydroxy 2-oxovalerate aldolase
MSPQILDCTLRDGGYLVDKDFSANTMYGVINGLTIAKIDYVEIGFLQNESNGANSIYKNANDARRWIPKERGSTIYTVLADYSRYSVENLEYYDGTSFDVVRDCFFYHERKGALGFARIAKEKGYKIFIQPVDILGYSDTELLDLIKDVNAMEPYGFSIVDTFGSMYLDDLRTVFSIIHKNLNPKIKLGFHSHNNLQMSSALAQEFVEISQNKRDVIVDTTLFGMGRGAGNTPTELIAQYFNLRLRMKYNIDLLLDLIDSYIQSIRTKVSWGYDIPMFVAGCYSSHVNNISYLMQKSTLRSQDMRFIVNQLTSDERKRYDYNHLEHLYLDYLHSTTDDSMDLSVLTDKLKNKFLLVLVPGKSLVTRKDTIKDYIAENKPIIIAINNIPANFFVDYVYFSNSHRFDYWKSDEQFDSIAKIITSNVNADKAEYVISFHRLVKTGWNNLDNSTILLLRLLDIVGVGQIAIAGFDGFSADADNYAISEMEYSTKDW